MDELVTPSHSDGTRTFVFLDRRGPARQRLLSQRHPASLDRQHHHQRLVPEIDHVLRACFD
ncbi:hypothetical protein ACIRP2_37895 [Streptomyces sp. NPDC101194]|uniref:hypothetical protein n=1 Tax=Streptomyces sp. NPDC101194 TaxID=3366127 RepID=UPI003806DD2C